MSIQRHLVPTNGIRIHVAEKGEGPLVLFVHGFPESWYSWRRQLDAVAEAGYRGAAIDVRGYGRSSKPTAVRDYRMILKVADLVGLVSALGEERATLVGHDWGAPIVWNTALLRPDLFRGVAGLSVPYQPRAATPPSQAFRRFGGENEFYIEYFQEVGRAEREIEADVRRWLLGFYFSASGDVPRGTPPMAIVERGKLLSDRFVYPTGEMPTWLSEQDLDTYAARIRSDRFSTGHSTAIAAPISTGSTWPPSRIGRSRSRRSSSAESSMARRSGARRRSSASPRTLPKLYKSVIVPGSGHWIQQEAADVTNTELLEFLAAIH